MNIFYSKPKGVAPLIIIGIIAILIIGGVIFVHTKSKKAQEENQPLRLENPKTTSITETRILEDCEKIKYQRDKNECYWRVVDVAEVKQDLSICEKIKDQYWKDDCYGRVAGAKQDLSICEKIKDQDWRWKNDCYGRVAAAKQDLSICEKIKGQDTKTYCYWDVAEAKQDSSICEKIEDQDKKESCGHYVDEAIFFDKPNN